MWQTAVASGFRPERAGETDASTSGTALPGPPATIGACAGANGKLSNSRPSIMSTSNLQRRSRGRSSNCRSSANTQQRPPWVGLRSVPPHRRAGTNKAAASAEGTHSAVALLAPRLPAEMEASQAPASVPGAAEPTSRPVPLLPTAAGQTAAWKELVARRQRRRAAVVLIQAHTRGWLVRRQHATLRLWQHRTSIVCSQTFARWRAAVAIQRRLRMRVDELAGASGLRHALQCLAAIPRAELCAELGATALAAQHHSKRLQARTLLGWLMVVVSDWGRRP